MDALRILRGGETSVTEFFAGKTREPLSEKFLPVVTRSTERLALTSKYNAVAAKATGIEVLRLYDPGNERLRS